MECTLIDYLGDDLRVANAARVSFNKESEWEMTREPGTGSLDGGVRLSEADQKLIRYLAKHEHFTPFTHVQITMRETVPIFVARQRFKHTVGFSYNEVSRRYVDDIPRFFIPEVWRGKPVTAKQGSSEEVITHLVYPGEESNYHPVNPPPFKIPIKDEYSYFLDEATRLYEKMIDQGVTPEQARMVLPQSMYTEFYSTGSLAAWARATCLRKDVHAQKEIQSLAQMWDTVIRGLPELKYSWEALVGNKWY